MRLTEGESRALLSAAILVLLAALGRSVFDVRAPAPAIEAAGIRSAGDVRSALTAAESIHAERARRHAPLAPDERLDVNRADAVELDRLPGVGAGRARAIVRHRESHGRFRSLAELADVPGLGPATVRRLAPHIITLPASTVQEGAAGSSDRNREAPGRVNLNRAGVEELVELPGLGPARAAAIVRWRKRHGPYRTFEDLLRVPGIGPVTVERLRSLATVGP